MSEKKRPPHEIDGDFRSFTLSLSTPLPPLLNTQDKKPVSKRVREYPFNVSDSGGRKVKYQDGPPFRRPRYSGALFPRKPPVDDATLRPSNTDAT